MFRPPFAARVVTGLIVTAIDQTRKLPTTAVTLPMTAVSGTLQLGMRVQQNIAGLAIKGDEALEALFHRSQEQPEWAVFDDDLDDDIELALPEARNPAPAPETADTDTDTDDAATPAADTVETVTGSAQRDRSGPEKSGSDEREPDETDAADPGAGSAGIGRFALYSSAPENVVRADVEASPVPTPSDAPEIVEFLDYDSLTLAQLRAKIRSVEVDDLKELAAYERAHRGRAPFTTMLDNRITAATSK